MTADFSLAVKQWNNTLKYREKKKTQQTVSLEFYMQQKYLWANHKKNVFRQTKAGKIHYQQNCAT